jgi:SNF2 family DNA or RNA helicase
MRTTLGIHEYKTTPYKHQDDAFKESRDRRFFALWWEMGTGKSKVITDTAAYLFLKQEIDGVVIMSDKGCYMNWHDREFAKHMPGNIEYRLAYWSSSMKSDARWKSEQLLKAVDNKLDILCINTESLTSPRAIAYLERFIKAHYCLFLVDESTSIKNPKAQRTKEALRLGHMCDYRRVLTGTPITQSPLDLFAQCEFLNPGILGFKSFVAFRSFYAEMQLVRLGPRAFNKIVGYRHMEHLTRSIAPFSSRITKAECLDLPEKVYEEVFVEHTIEQAELYNKLKTEALLQLEQGLLTSTSAITTINKLHQINCGHVKLDDGTQVDIPSGRLPALVDLIENIGRKCVVWCAHQRDVEQIMMALRELFKGSDMFAVHYYGKTTDDERSKNLISFKHNPYCKVFVGTAATGGKGIDGLQDVCDYQIYYSNSYNLEDRLQSEDRLHRNGQKNAVTIIDLICRGTVDVAIHKSLASKEDLAHNVLDKIRDVLN